MKRRAFIGTLGAAAAAGVTGCAARGPRVTTIAPQKPVPNKDILKVTKPKPPAGSLKVTRLGKTDIKLTNFAFGSHLPESLVPFEQERGTVIRTAYDYGIRVFDVYDIEHRCFQYEPMGRHLKSVINDVTISITCSPYDNRSFEEEIHRDLKAFGRDYLDMVRIHVTNPESKSWADWDKLFKFKQEGKIRAVGIPIHYEADLARVLGNVPIDYVVLPYNFYHNLLYTGKFSDDFNPLGKKLKDSGVGIVVMKPMASEWFISHFVKMAKKLNPDISLPQAMHRYIINSPLDPDTTFTGMWCMDDLYDNLPAYFNPRMSAEENDLLDKMRTYAKITEEAALPAHYKFLNRLARHVTPDPEAMKLFA